MDTLTVYFLLLAFCLLDVLSMKTNSTLQEEGKIIDGEETFNTVEFAYHAYLLMSDGRKLSQCGGSIIADNYVLTAASCLLGQNIAQIRIGSTSSDSNAQNRDYASQSFEIHPWFNSRNNDYDVGLIYVERGMYIDGVRTRRINLPRIGREFDPPPGLEIRITGWGLTHENDTEFPIILHEAITHVVDRKACSQMIGRRVTSRQFCAGETLRDEHPDDCLGDYGGPVRAVIGTVFVAESNQLGIASYGRRSCGHINAPSVYTRVDISSIRMFIYYEAGV